MVTTIVIGLGNPILGDDGVGWRVADTFARQNTDPAVAVENLALGGLSLMERLIGYERVIIVDAIQTAGGRIGDVYQFDLADLPDLTTGYTTAVHDTSLQTALQLGRQLGANLPAKIHIVAIEAERVYDFSEELTPAVETAVSTAVQIIHDLLKPI